MTWTACTIKCRLALRQSIAYWKERLGHTTIDLGIAPTKLESYQNGEVTQVDPMERLKSVRGHLVSFPLDFMCKEDLRPVFNESEYYASPQVFHWVRETQKVSKFFFQIIQKTGWLDKKRDWLYICKTCLRKDASQSFFV